MSQRNENIRIARELFDAVAQRDVARMLELTDPEVELRSFFAELGEGGVYRGHDGIRQYIRDMDDAWEVLDPNVEDEVAVGAMVLLIGQLHYRGRGSGVDVSLPAGWLMKFERGRLVFLRALRDPEQDLEAAARRE